VDAGFARVDAAFARGEADFARVDAGFARSLFAAPARVVADLPACLTASPAAFAAAFTPVAAPRAALRAWPAASRASLACRVEAAFFPVALDEVRCWFRFLVAAAFFAAAERSALVCATCPPGSLVTRVYRPASDGKPPAAPRIDSRERWVPIRCIGPRMGWVAAPKDTETDRSTA
jgi:hypothetical protein